MFVAFVVAQFAFPDLPIVFGFCPAYCVAFCRETLYFPWHSSGICCNMVSTAAGDDLDSDFAASDFDDTTAVDAAVVGAETVVVSSDILDFESSVDLEALGFVLFSLQETSDLHFPDTVSLSDLLLSSRIGPTDLLDLLFGAELVAFALLVGTVEVAD